MMIHVIYCCYYYYYFFYFFFFNDTATTEIYTLSLHDALPIYNFEAMERCGIKCEFALHNHLMIANYLYVGAPASYLLDLSIC